MAWKNTQAAHEAKVRTARAYAQGVSAFEAGNFALAEEIFTAIVLQEPRLDEVWNALCLVALHGAVPEIAMEHARRAIELDRRNVEYLNNLGIASGELGRFDEAEQGFRRALKIKPAHVEAHFNLAKVLHKQGRLAESLKEYERAHALNPASVRTQQGLADAYYLHGRPARALEIMRAAGASDNPGILTQRYALCLADVEGPQAALSWLRSCLAREASGRYTHGPLGEISLSLGQWREGWKYYCLFYRERRAPGHIPELTPLPRRLDGKRVLVRDEQGVGDILFFLRFVEELHERGASVTVSCPARIAALLKGERTFAIVEESAEQGRPWDFDVLTTDLPALLETEAVPASLKLHVDEGARKRAQDLLARFGPGPHLGVTWRAGTDMLRSREFGAGRAVLSKEIAPTLLGRALRGWPGTVVSLQRGATTAELEAFGSAIERPVHDVALADEDLQLIAGVLEALDDYVAVSNTNMHLLAGLGRRARVLVPHPPFWRWMREGSSVWFPGFPVYRQSKERDWVSALTRLREDLLLR